MAPRTTAGVALGAGLAVSALVLAGCSAAPTEEPGSDVLRVAFGSDLDPNDVTDYLGVTSSGAEIVELTDDSAAVAGLVNGNFDIVNIDASGAVKALQAGVPLKIVYTSQLLPEFVFVAQSDITDVADLEGKDVAYHGAGSLTEVLPKTYVEQQAPELFDTIQWTVLPESPNRAAAMIAGRIDATALEYGDVLTLEEEGDFSILANWGDLEGDSSAVLNTVWVTTDKILGEKRELTVDFLTSLQESYDAFYADKDAWLAAAAEELPDANPEFLPLIYDYYAEVGMYAKSGENPLNEERWTAMDEFYISIGEYADPTDLSAVDFELAAEVNGS